MFVDTSLIRLSCPPQERFRDESVSAHRHPPVHFQRARIRRSSAERDQSGRSLARSGCAKFRCRRVRDMSCVSLSPPWHRGRRRGRVRGMSGRSSDREPRTRGSRELERALRRRPCRRCARRLGGQLHRLEDIPDRLGLRDKRHDPHTHVLTSRTFQNVDAVRPSEQPGVPFARNLSVKTSGSHCLG